MSRTPQLSNSTENSIHFRRARSSRVAFHDLLSYQTHVEVPTTYPCCTNEINHIFLILVDEKVVVTDSSSPSQIRALHPKRKSVVQIKDVVRNCNKAGNWWWILKLGCLQQQRLECCYQSSSDLFRAERIRSVLESR